MSQDTSQKERMLAALRPDYFQVDKRSIRALYAQAQALAEVTVFHEPRRHPANWSVFFRDIEPYLLAVGAEAGQSDSPLPTTGQCPPHLALFLTFLRLFGHTQRQMNGLTASHLHFFYHRILGQAKKPASPDTAYVFLELARNVEKYRLPHQTPLLAGKDALGKDILYFTDREIFLDQTRVAQCKAFRAHKDADSPEAFPVADSSDGFGAPLEEGQGWYPFGNPGVPAAPAEIGLGISSPMLLLREGKRTVELSFALVSDSADSYSLNPLQPTELEARLTGPTQWFTKEVSEISCQAGRLTLVIRLSEADPPVVALDKNKPPERLPLDWPVLKVVLRPGYAYRRYAFLQALRFSGVAIKVAVEKAHSLRVRNDFGDLDATKAFQPFGYHPVKGANVYVGMPEAFLKPLTTLAVTIRWKGRPENFKTYYEGYLGPTNSLVSANDDFRVRAAIRYQREWLALNNPAATGGEFPLFDQTLAFDVAAYPKEQATVGRDSTDEDGLIRLSLSSPLPAFGHTLYPTVYARAIVAQFQNQETLLPNEPYTPVVESVDLAYTAQEDIDLSKAPATPFCFFYVEPFGIKTVFTLAGTSVAGAPAAGTLVALPACPLVSGEFHHAGSLYLGLENLRPPQPIALFLEIEEENGLDKPAPEFYYLGKTGWQGLSQNQVLSDSTRGLKQTGILVLNLPAGLVSDNPMMPDGCHWVRVSVPDHPENFDRIINVRMNAVSCTRHPGAPSPATSDGAHLPAFSIRGFSRKIAEIKKVEQPYRSFGGRPAEEETAYFTRVSEKLRHKMRGISAWDLERLVLEQFPDVYQVKCLPHRDADGRVTPGSIHLLVIPLIKHHRKKILKPLVANSTLSEIKEYVEQCSSPFAKIEVTNPRYEEITVVTQVGFNGQVDAGFYLDKLQSDLQRFLSPWAFQEKSDIQLGTQLYRSSIIEYIESRPYVNFIASIKLLKNGKVIRDDEIGSDAQSVIVSSAGHVIEAIETDGVACQTNQGIEQMIVDINFEVQ